MANNLALKLIILIGCCGGWEYEDCYHQHSEQEISLL
jgi:hypothetical protein